MPVAAGPVAKGGRLTMNVDFEPVYAHHDLLIEIGRVELAMENLEERAGEESSTLLPRLLSRMNNLREALDRLSV
jgi:hypothetical protein